MMRPVIVSVVLLLGAATQSNAQKMSTQLVEEGYKRYGLESGIVEFRVEANMMKTSETIYFDRWGLRETKQRRTEINVGSISQTQNAMEFLDGETTVNVDLDNKRGTRIKNNLLTTIADRTSSKNMEEASEKFLKAMGGKKIGEEAVLGKTCQVWDIQSLKAKNWVWKNIALKAESGLGGMTTTITAVRVEENAKIPVEKFKIPDGIPITESGSIPDILKGIKEKQKPKGK